MPMLKRLLPSLRKRLATLTWPEGRGIVRRDGVLYLLNLNSRNWYDKRILCWGAPESEQRRLMIDNIRKRKCDIFLDIGANFGMYALNVAANTDCGTVIAFEPDSRSYDKLRANLLINDLLQKVQTRMVAVSDKTGTVPFKLGPANDASSSEIGDNGSGFSVPCLRLDDELRFTGRRIAMKIDAQFHEMEVLEGMRNLLSNNDCFLQVETVDDYAPKFIAAMQAEGYEHLRTIEGIDHFFAKPPG
jgi:FkbM family methyltransferase